jgi:NAD(P)-dependent dehydrogenase (short-subunit alcohol dehydrogenase family)
VVEVSSDRPATAGPPEEGRVAIVTGGGSGLGRATAEVLADGGLRVVVVGRRLDPLLETAATERAGAIVPMQADVDSPEDRRRIVEQTTAELGRIDILVNNAGISRPAPLLSYDVERWRSVLTTNLESCFFLAQAVLPVMIEQSFGRIVNIASVYGSLGLNAGLYAGLFKGDAGEGPERNPAYHSSKGALLNMTRDLAIAVAPWGVTVNAISPGMFVTEQSEGILNDEVVANLSKLTPIGRFGQPREIGYAVKYLASDEAGFVTGANLHVDGGWSAW